MASGSRPLSDQPTDDQSQPSHSTNIPLSASQQPTPKIAKVFERRKKHKVPSLGVSTAPHQPSSPVLEHSPIQNIERESHGVSPNSKKVHPKEQVVHMGGKAATTSASTEKDSGNISKTFPTATQSKKLDRGPRRQETMGAASASARQKTTATSSKDPVKKVTTSKTGEDSYTVEELMETMSNINLDVIAQGKEIDSLKKVVLYQQKQLDKQKKVIFKLLHKKKRSQFVLKRRILKDDAPKKGEIEPEIEQNMEPNMQSFEPLEIEVERMTPLRTPQRTPAGKQDAIMMEAEKEIAEEKGEMEVPPAMSANVSTAESEKAVVTEEAAETVNAAKTKEAVVTEAAAETTSEAAVSEKEEAAVTRQPAVTVNTAELVQFIIQQLAGDIVVESLEEIVLRKAERLVKKVAEVKVSAEPPKPDLKRTKMMTKKRKSSQEEIEERKAKRTKKREEKQKKREEKKKEKEYFEQHMIVENPNPQQPIEATPLEAQPPEIVHWDTFVDEDSENDYIRIKRADGQFDVQGSIMSILRCYSRTDLVEMHKVGKNLYRDLLGEDVEFSYTKMVLEHLCCMFEPETIDYLIRRPFERVIKWTLHENCAVHSIVFDTGLFEFYLVERTYRHSFKRLNGMMAVKLKCKTGSAMGEYLVKRTMNQQLGLDPNLGLN